MHRFLFILFMFVFSQFQGQNHSTVSGTVTDVNGPLPFVHVFLKNTSTGTLTNENGMYTLTNIPEGAYTLMVSSTGYKTVSKTLILSGTDRMLDFELEIQDSLDEVVVTGTLKPVSRLESPVPVEVYSPTFLKKNPTSNVFEALQNINGVRPQLNCNVCNTGDIHINGLEGPYTLVLIDGMPIVSGLSTVYGLSGIPNALIEQIELVKGPASSLYGSEAVGGLLNIITKLPEHAPRISVDGFITDWGEVNADLGFKSRLGETADFLLGINYYNYTEPKDSNADNFTDITLQNRISVFQKWAFSRKNQKNFSLAGRYFYEDRWGGEMQWNKSHRGGSAIYGESIYTSRFELIGTYDLPVKENLKLQFSYADHDQNSVYGNLSYLARQRITFGQLIWDATSGNHDLLTGIALRHTFYNDNTPATATADKTTIPSVFIQDEILLTSKQRLLLGARLDYHTSHGTLFTPRIAYRYKPGTNDIIRLNAGTGFRVVNLFTEEHAALTGARDVIVTEQLEPERSYNLNVNYLKKIYTKNGRLFTLDASAWYTYFTRAILPDYDTNPNAIIYSNLDGYATSKGLSLTLEAVFASGITAWVGFTYQDVSQTRNGIRLKQMLTESFSGTWTLSYKNYPTQLTLDYTGSLYGPMRLPTLGSLDPRSDTSPVWSIQNVQLRYEGLAAFELYGGVKNVFNWTPGKREPFLIARAHDPFDENVSYDSQGNVQVTEENPYALTFDPSYVYAPQQGRRVFVGLRYTLK